MEERGMWTRVSQVALYASKWLNVIEKDAEKTV